MRKTNLRWFWGMTALLAAFPLPWHLIDGGYHAQMAALNTTLALVLFYMGIER